MSAKNAIILTFALLVLSTSRSFAVCDFGADTCLQGYVWREAFPGDHVCVTAATRSQAQTDNSLADQRKVSNSKATCLPGYVWRLASPNDVVCVPPATRNQTATDNAQASARRDPQCAYLSDTTTPSFIQNTITFYRISDNMQVGTAVIPPGTGLTIPAVARDRRFVIATSAGDNESGIASFQLQGGESWNCTDRLNGTAANKQGTISAVSDEAKNGTAASGHPLVRSEHFSLDPLSGNPQRAVCPCTNDSGPLTVTMTVVTQNGNKLSTTSAPVTLVYAAQPPTCGAASGQICGNNVVGQVLNCADGRNCDFKRSTVCSGWWIFRHCDKIQTTDMFCP